MVKAADIGSKRLINLAPDAWLQWVTQLPEVVAKEILGSEFHWISRETDVLVKAYSATHGDFLVLNELQLRYTAQMPLRMRAYTALAQERYRLPTYPVLINILPPTSTLTIVNSYEQEFLGLRAIQDYRVINLWEIDAEIAFEQPLPSLLPFVPILRGGGELSVVQRALQALRADAQLNELESLLAFFASFVLDTPLVQQMMRWDMAAFRESSWYHEIEQRGIQEGARRQLIRVLEQRFGEISHEVEVRLEGKSVEQLENLMDSALAEFTVGVASRREGIAVNSLDEFMQILST
ncbi:MAG: Rpn family recombination-promoting nuclease/putative transposase [Nostoc sp.]|uniref:Rpn family recombination-promoting nuclease/putative transposase n=1 Tax=Nostoc sp. TaxID=1180 RepID=UPI002FF993AB